MEVIARRAVPWCMLVGLGIGILYSCVTYWNMKVHAHIATTEHQSQKPGYKNLNQVIVEEDYLKNLNNCTSVGFSPQNVNSISSGTRQNYQDCSLKTFSDFSRAAHTFPADGHWCNVNDTINRQQLVSFIPTMCKYTSAKMDSDDLKQCLSHKRIYKIVTIGDSQAGRHYTALFGEMATAMDECKIIKAEHNGRLEIKLDPTYFVRSNMTHYDKSKVPKSLKDVGCRVCIGILRECHYTIDSHTYTIQLEHLRMSSQPKDSPYLKYVFQNYLKGDRAPDIITILPPSNHLKKANIKDVQALFTLIKSLMEKNLKPTTQIIWIPSAREVELYKPDKYKDQFYQGSTATKQIHKINRLVYGIMQEEFEDSNSRFHGFWDLVNIARDSWGTDGVHFLPIWYSTIQRLLLQTICL